VRPWLWVGRALLFLAAFLVYPMVHTLLLSFTDASGQHWIGLANYRFAFQEVTS